MPPWLAWRDGGWGENEGRSLQAAEAEGGWVSVTTDGRIGEGG